MFVKISQPLGFEHTRCDSVNGNKLKNYHFKMLQLQTFVLLWNQINKKFYAGLFNPFFILMC
jgi:hypothetical protein